jgi:hypothetical protein
MSCLINGVPSLAQTGIDSTTTYTAHTTDFAGIMKQPSGCGSDFLFFFTLWAIDYRCQLPQRFRKMNQLVGARTDDFFPVEKPIPAQEKHVDSE